MAATTKSFIGFVRVRKRGARSRFDLEQFNFDMLTKDGEISTSNLHQGAKHAAEKDGYEVESIVHVIEEA